MVVIVKHSNVKDNYKRGKELGKLVLNHTPKTVAVLQLGGSLHDVLVDAYRYTNSIDEAWYKNPDISVDEEAQKGCRSTSIGDVIEVCGVAYMVDSFDFLCLDDLAEKEAQGV